MPQDIDLTPIRRQYSFFAQRLLDDLGLSDLKQPLRSELLAGIEAYVSQVLTNTIIMNLDDATINAMAKRIDSGEEQDELIAYMVASTPNLSQKLDETFAETYDKIKAEIQELTKATIDAQFNGSGKSSEQKPEIDTE